MGVEYAQGYFIARPHAHPVVELPGILTGGTKSSVRRYQDHFTSRVREIVMDSVIVAPGTNAETVVKMFRADVRLTCVPVIDGNTPLGMVSRAEILNVFSRRFAHELHAHKPIRDFISPLSVIVDVATDLKVVGQLISEDPDQNLSVDFIVSENEQYLGVGKVRDLLRAITEEKLRTARHSNPLTQLPGNVPLYEWVDHLLLHQKAFVVAYCDINHFKPFNDAFGYSAGDEAILRLSRILCECVDLSCDFIGHVGGDDFILVMSSPDWQQRCEQILHRFAEAGRQLLPPNLTEYWSLNRQGQQQKFGALSLAIGCVSPDLSLCKTHHQVSQLLAEAKHNAKMQGGNTLYYSPHG